MVFIELTKLLDGEPVAIAADQVGRVHGRRGPQGRMFAEVYVIGAKKPIAVFERFDQVSAVLTAAGVKFAKVDRVGGNMADPVPRPPAKTEDPANQAAKQTGIPWV